MSTFRSAATILLVCASLSGCKIIKTPTAEEAAKANGGGFDPEHMVGEIWGPKVVPFFEAKAAPLTEIMSAAAGDGAAAG
ncbi:MAG: DUF2291 family protein, partial [Alphaproteobacteria bacterium]